MFRCKKIKKSDASNQCLCNAQKQILSSFSVLDKRHKNAMEPGKQINEMKRV